MSKRAEKKAAKAAAARQAAVENRVVDAGDWLAKEIGALAPRLQDGVRSGGIGSLIRQSVRRAGVDTALNEVGLPTEFLTHGSRSQVLERVGLTAQQITRDTVDSVLGTRVPYARPVGEDASALRFEDRTGA